MDEELEARDRLKALVPACDVEAVLDAAGAVFVARMQRLVDLDRLQFVANVGLDSDISDYEQFNCVILGMARWAALMES